MNPAARKRNARVAPGVGVKSGLQASGNRITSRPFRVLIRGARVRDWSRYPTEHEAEAAARRLREFGFDCLVVDDGEVLR